jgi:hypothetical protein
MFSNGINDDRHCRIFRQQQEAEGQGHHQGNSNSQYLVDSGASISLVSERTFDGIWGAAELRRLPLPRHLLVAGVTGADIQVVDYVEAEISTTEAILSYDYVKQEGLIVDGARNKVYFSKEVPHAAA